MKELIEKYDLGNVIKGRFKIMKSDDEKMLAFGWANVSMRVDGELIEDWQADIIEPEELENAAYEYVLLYLLRALFSRKRKCRLWAFLQGRSR